MTMKKDQFVDSRFTPRDEDMHIEKEGEFYDDESDQDSKETKSSTFRTVQQKTVYGSGLAGLSTTITSSAIALPSTYPRNRRERETEIRDKERDRD